MNEAYGYIGMCFTCSARTSSEVKRLRKGAPLAAASTAGRPFASVRSTRQTTPIDAHPRGMGGLDGGDGRAAGGAYVVDDEHRRILFRKAFDLPACAVRLLRFAHEKAVDQTAFAGIAVVLRAGDGHRGDDGIGAEGEAADGVRIEMMLVQQIEDGDAGEASAFGVERGGAAVDVVVAASAGGELEVAELEGLAGEQGEQLLAGAGGSASSSASELWFAAPATARLTSPAYPNAGSRRCR